MAASSVVSMAGKGDCSAAQKDLHLIDGWEKNWGYPKVTKAGSMSVVAKGVSWGKKKDLVSAWILVGGRVSYLERKMAGQKVFALAEHWVCNMAHCLVDRLEVGQVVRRVAPMEIVMVDYSVYGRVERLAGSMGLLLAD